MKKIIVVLIIGILFLTGCEEKKKLEVDYSEYSFTDVSWTRDGENDIETIRFMILICVKVIHTMTKLKKSNLIVLRLLKI